jgi:hypothetical protein
MSTDGGVFQLKGDMTLRIQHEGKPYPSDHRGRFTCRETSPRRCVEGTVGLIVERVRKGELLDTIAGIARTATMFCSRRRLISRCRRDMPPIFEAYSNPQNQVYKARGNVNAGRPARK